MQKGKILAVDYGKSKVGLAVSDFSREFVFGRGILRHKTENQLNEDLKKLIEQEGVITMVFGLPTSLNGEETPQTVRIREFVANLTQYLARQGLKIGVEYVDESFSSFEAQTELLNLGKNMKEIKQMEDELVAVNLLHKFLNKKNN